jgi:hypothetical protein
MDKCINSTVLLLLSLCVELIYGAGTRSTAAERTAHSALSKAVDSIDEQGLKSHVRFLASDALEGREAGSEGSRAAAVYLLEQFETNGLEPAGSDGSYEQSFGKNYRNLLGMLPGSDPELTDDVIVIGAHYDHVGYGYSGNSRGTVGQIHNGADDNGSGVAALIEIVEALHQAQIRPSRTILFVLWDAEELGLLGSKHWIRHPTIDLKRVKLYINLDMVGRLRENNVEVYGCRTADGLRRLCSLTNTEQLELEFNWNLRPDSDHYPFLQQDIPFLMPFTRKHVDYHRASDDFDKVNYAGQKTITRHWLRILLTAAEERELPEFRATCRQEHEGLRKRIESATVRKASRLGISWNTQESEQEKVLIIRNLTANSPAWKAGLRIGDRILAINGLPFTTSARFIRNVSASVPESSFLVQRAGSEESEEIPLQLNGEPVLVGLEFRADTAESKSLVISRVVADSPADSAGLQVNDRIVRVVGGDTNSDEPAAKKLLATHAPFEVDYERSGIVKRVELKPLNLLSPMETAGAE